MNDPLEHFGEQQVGRPSPASSASYRRADAETVLDWAEEVQYPGTRALPNDVTGNHPGSYWDGKPHIHMTRAGHGGHVPVAPGVRPR